MVVTTIRPLRKSDYTWLPQNIPTGTELHTFHGCTYGCITPEGIAVGFEEDAKFFFEVPKDAILMKGNK